MQPHIWTSSIHHVPATGELSIDIRLALRQSVCARRRRRHRCVFFIPSTAQHVACQQCSLLVWRWQFKIIAIVAILVTFAVQSTPGRLWSSCIFFWHKRWRWRLLLVRQWCQC